MKSNSTIKGLVKNIKYSFKKIWKMNLKNIYYGKQCNYEQQLTYLSTGI